MANTLNSFWNGAVGFIDWLGLSARIFYHTSEIGFRHEALIMQPPVVAHVVEVVQSVAQKIEPRFMDSRIALLRGGDATVYHLPILVSDRPTGREAQS